MENQRTEYIQSEDYERSENRQNQRNGYYERNYTIRVGELELKIPRRLDGKFSPTIFERYQRNEKALLSEKNYPYLMTDILYIKVREENRVLSKSCHMAIGISNDGDHEILGSMIQNEESEDTWSYFFEYLKNRGLRGTELVISDAHKGLVSAIRQSFINTSWQRCQVHFLRNILTSIPKKNSKPFREAVKQSLGLQIST